MGQGIDRVGIVGAGAMGRGIAQICAAAGCYVNLFDSAPGSVNRAITAVREDLAAGVAKGKLSQGELDATLARILPTNALAELGDCELVVEAIIEDLAAKQGLLKLLEAVVSRTCILATNTSSLSVTAIAAVCEEPGRVVGWHFFNPVPRMKLVEIVQAPRTSPDVTQALMALSTRVGHRAVVTSDSPGFVVNHAGRAFVTEGLKLLAEQCADHQSLDTIMRGAGFRMGPLELLDLTGLDVSVPVMESIHAQYYGDDRYRPVPLARTRMLAGLLGRKSKKGFYDYASRDAKAAEQGATLSGSDARLWWPVEGSAALPDSVAVLLSTSTRQASAADSDVIVLAPLGDDLSTTIAKLGLDASKAVAIDPMFCSAAGVTLMVSPATSAAALAAAKGAFAAGGTTVSVIADSPGYVAPRIVACVVNLACEMAQQGIASPQDIDAAVRLALGYPMGPFEWGERLGAGRVLQVLNGLHQTFGDQRYRPSPWLVRRVQLGLPLITPDRSN